jgi:hypothetical protein
MSDLNDSKEILEFLQKELGLQHAVSIPEEEIIKQIGIRVEVLLKRGHGSFFQLMYRLDVSEKDLSTVIDDDDAPYKIARLIYDRQIQKIKSRQQHKKDKPDIEKDLEW